MKKGNERISHLVLVGRVEGYLGALLSFVFVLGQRFRDVQGAVFEEGCFGGVTNDVPKE
jgi:hypothetical protein